MRKLRGILLAALGALVLAGMPSSASAAPVMAVADEATCVGRDTAPLSMLAQFHATVLHTYVNFAGYDSPGSNLGCVRQAWAAGYEVYLSVVYDNGWTPDQVAAWFRQVLPAYAPYLWAVSVGNEQDLWQGGHDPSGPFWTTATTDRLVHRGYVTHPLLWRWVHRVRRHHRWVRLRRRRRVPVYRRIRRHHRWVRVRARRTVQHPAMSVADVRMRPSYTPAEEYRRVWDVVEPVLAALVPNAIRVYGEGSPWGANDIINSWAYDGTRPVGAQVVAFHAYDTTTGGLEQVPAMAAWAASAGVPLWASEMAPAPPDGGSLPPWLLSDTRAEWDAKLAAVEAESPDLRMISYFAGWDSEPGATQPRGV